jgi:hypothetical protein
MPTEYSTPSLMVTDIISASAAGSAHSALGRLTWRLGHLCQLGRRQGEVDDDLFLQGRRAEKERLGDDLSCVSSAQRIRPHLLVTATCPSSGSEERLLPPLERLVLLVKLGKLGDTSFLSDLPSGCRELTATYLVALGHGRGELIVVGLCAGSARSD